MMTVVLIALTVLGLVVAPCVIGLYVRASLDTVPPRATHESWPAK